ncbi:MAG TPA: response regulator transcription factor [Vicinamibacterales bacterium]|nr:response regulator transcription factor [Vicinamibacterales bacterium]
MTTNPPSHERAANILIVEDEPQMRRLLTDNLEFEGYGTRSVASGEEALSVWQDAPWDLIILDVMLPGASGLEVCRELRARHVRTPLIMLTARAEEADRVIGLDLGADDYVTKPFSVRELLARVRAQLRRHGRQGEGPGEYVLGDSVINLRTRTVIRRGIRVDLSAREFDLLRYLLAHRGEVVTREQLLRDVWGYAQSPLTRTVDNFIAKLRNHIEPQPHDPRYILTVHGTGYQLVV